VGKKTRVVHVAKLMREGLFDYFAQFVAVVREPEVIGRAHFERPDFIFREVTDYQIEATEVVAAERFLAFGGHHDFVAKPSEGVFENTQLIVIIHDENPALFH
jgi:hypothetical protein